MASKRDKLRSRRSSQRKTRRFESVKSRKPLWFKAKKDYDARRNKQKHAIYNILLNIVALDLSGLFFDQICFYHSGGESFSGEVRLETKNRLMDA